MAHGSEYSCFAVCGDGGLRESPRAARLIIIISSSSSSITRDRHPIQLQDGNARGFCSHPPTACRSKVMMLGRGDEETA